MLVLLSFRPSFFADFPRCDTVTSTSINHAIPLTSSPTFFILANPHAAQSPIFIRSPAFSESTDDFKQSSVDPWCTTRRETGFEPLCSAAVELDSELFAARSAYFNARTIFRSDAAFDEREDWWIVVRRRRRECDRETELQFQRQLVESSSSSSKHDDGTNDKRPDQVERCTAITAYAIDHETAHQTDPAGESEWE